MNWRRGGFAENVPASSLLVSSEQAIAAAARDSHAQLLSFVAARAGGDLARAAKRIDLAISHAHGRPMLR